jgi:hypothetical protein
MPIVVFDGTSKEPLGLMCRLITEVDGFRYRTLRDLLVAAFHKGGFYACQLGCECVGDMLQRHELPASFTDMGTTPTPEEVSVVSDCLAVYISVHFEEVIKIGKLDNVAPVPPDFDWSTCDVQYVHPSQWGVAAYTPLVPGKDVYGDRNVIGDLIRANLALVSDWVMDVPAPPPLLKDVLHRRLNAIRTTADIDAAVDLIADLASTVLINAGSPSETYHKFVSLRGESMSDVTSWEKIPDRVVVVHKDVPTYIASALAKIGKVVRSPVIDDIKTVIKLYTSHSLDTEKPVLFHGTVVTDGVYNQIRNLSVFRAPLTLDDIVRVVSSDVPR